MNKLILHAVGVLILIDQNVLKAPAVIVEHRGGGDKELQRLEQQVVKVERIVVLQALFVEAVNLYDLLHAEILVRLGKVLVRGEHIHLCVADLCFDLARRIGFIGKIELL